MADFSEVKIQSVWEKGFIIKGKDQEKWRKDVCGALMYRKFYGRQDIDYGWNIDHIYPESKGGNHDIDNLRPMHWENNLSKSDNYPTYTSVKTSEGDKNISQKETWDIGDDLQTALKLKFDLKNADEAFTIIHKHLQKCSGEKWSDYYVGTNQDPKNQVFNVHKVPEDNSCWIITQVISESEAQKLKNFLINDKGMKGNLIDNNSIFVYCYLITNVTIEKIS